MAGEPAGEIHDRRADTVRNRTGTSPAGEHLLDWFHITMRITVMGQYVKGLSHPNPLGRLLRRIKGYLGMATFMAASVQSTTCSWTWKTLRPITPASMP